ncbi:MAG: histidine--tRNA ligase [Firmicutes bacterium]|nr:histidine--tRNA ligase [Bacillota bacterium]
MINIPKGTKDVLPQDSHKWHYVEETAREVCRKYSVREIRTPVFEHTELFLRGIGEGTDVVGKEMYTFEDKGGRSITLKPEGTAGVARSYVENSLEQLSLPLKMYYFSPVFRYERPQAGRLREHHQFGVEFYGSVQPSADFEVISLAYEFLSKVGVKVKLELNSIGCPECKPKYNETLKKYLEKNAKKLCPTCVERTKTNPMRTIDCKVDACKDTLQKAPLISGHICGGCKEHLNITEKYLKLAKIPYNLNPRIVRGLDYYTKTVFEFVTDALGAQGTVCGGGRYDKLVESIGGKSTPCVGFGLGLERLLMLMDALKASIPNAPVPDIVLINQSETAFDTALGLAIEMRKNGLAVETDNMNRSVKAQLKYADKLGAKYAAVIGESELVSKTVDVKKMIDASSKKVSFDKIIEYLTNS